MDGAKAYNTDIWLTIMSGRCIGLAERQAADEILLSRRKRGGQCRMVGQ